MIVNSSQHPYPFPTLSPHALARSSTEYPAIDYASLARHCGLRPGFMRLCRCDEWWRARPAKVSNYCVRMPLPTPLRLGARPPKPTVGQFWLRTATAAGLGCVCILYQEFIDDNDDDDEGQMGDTCTRDCPNAISNPLESARFWRAIHVWQLQLRAPWIAEEFAIIYGGGGGKVLAIAHM